MLMNWDLSFLFSIRGILAGSIALVAMVKILRNPFFGLLFFLFLLMVRPQEMEIFPGMEKLPIVKVFSFLTIFSLIVHSLRIKVNINKMWSTQSLLMLLFGLVLAISGSFSTIAFRYFIEHFLPIIVVFFLINLLFVEERQVKTFLCLYTLLTTYISLYGICNYHNIFGFTGMVEYDSGIDRLIYYDPMNDPNALALILVSSVPLLMTFMHIERKPPVKVFFVLSLIVHLYGIRLTFSRGGFIALVFAIFGFGLTSRRRMFYSVASIGLIALFFVTSSPDYRWRMLSLRDAGRLEAMDRSAVSRVEVWRAGINMIKKHPYGGIGMGQFAKNVFQYLSADSTLHRAYTAHNSFVLVAAEAGLPGLVLYLLIIVTAFSNLFKQYKLTKRKEEEAIGANCFVRPLMISLLSVLLCGLFLSIAYIWFFYIFVAIAESIKNMAYKDEAYNKARA